MAKPKVYVETSLVSYLTARPSRDVVMIAHQQVTRAWWEKQRADYDLYTSQLVIKEAGTGDPTIATMRQALLAHMTALALTPEVESLANKLVDSGTLPVKAGDDALHIAFAAVHGIDYLVTWNCRHMANATMRSQIEAVCRTAGFEPPIICTPDELLGEEQDDA
jgi:predicted nucleic acid-binding protein